MGEVGSDGGPGGWADQVVAQVRVLARGGTLLGGLRIHDVAVDDDGRDLVLVYENDDSHGRRVGVRTPTPDPTTWFGTAADGADAAREAARSVVEPLEEPLGLRWGTTRRAHDVWWWDTREPVPPPWPVQQFGLPPGDPGLVDILLHFAERAGLTRPPDEAYPLSVTGAAHDPLGGAVTIHYVVGSAADARADTWRHPCLVADDAPLVELADAAWRALESLRLLIPADCA